MLAYFNLNAGGMFNGSTWTAYANPTYEQDETMKGVDENSSNFYVRYGTVKFATESGWEYANNDTIPTDKHNSYLKTALDEYSKIITTSMGKTMTARLITYNELKNLGCSDSSWTCTTSSYSWVYSSSYWTGSAYSGGADYVWVVRSAGNFYTCEYSDSFYYFGVRPVLDISVSDI